MVKYDVTYKTTEEPVEVLTVDDLHVPVKATVTYRPSPSHLRELHLELGPGFYE
jgi:hypothetical protein